MMGTDMSRQSGFTTFTITLPLAVLILLGISLLVGKMLVADRRVTLNEVLYRRHGDGRAGHGGWIGAVDAGSGLAHQFGDNHADHGQLHRLRQWMTLP